MPLTTNQKNNFYGLARDYWLEAHRKLRAYERHYRHNRRISDLARLLTLLSAIATAILAAMPTPWLPLVTGIGILTAVLSAIDQAFNPTSASQKFWDCRMLLESIKRDVVSCAISIEASTDVSSISDLLNQISKRLGDAASVPFDVSSDDEQAAVSAFKSSIFHLIIERNNQHEEPQEETPTALGEDAPDIMIASRVRIAAPGVAR